MAEWNAEIRVRLERLRIDPGREASIAEELSQHLEDRYEDLLIEGRSEAEARRIALDELNETDLAGISLPPGIRNSARSEDPPATYGSGNVAVDFVRDLKFGLRAMGRAPAFTLFAVLTLALGIGASTTVFTVVNTLLLHPLPARDPSRLVALYMTDTKSQRGAGNLLPMSYLNLKDYQARHDVFSDVGGSSPPMVMTLTENSESQRF